MLATREAMERHRRPDGTVNQTAVAKDLGLSRSATQERMKRVSADLDHDAGVGIKYPHFPSEEMPTDDLLDHLSKRFEQRHKAKAARKWFPITVPESKPYGVLWFGDPHLDDDGCNWPMLRQHVKLAARTPGIYGANIGDTTNNWCGKLSALYSKQSTSKKDAHQLARWFLQDSGVSWLLWILGNHDLWDAGADVLKGLRITPVPMEEWQAQFVLKDQTGCQTKIHASHHFKGTSIWNNLHGAVRAVKLSEQADVYIQGHHHDYGLWHTENADRGFTAWLCKLRGYKHFDSHALRHGFPESQTGAAILQIVNPRFEDPSKRVMMYHDVFEGARYLTWLRSQ